MRKLLVTLVTILALVISANAQMKIAVMDFKAGAGVTQMEVDGISAIFGTYFIDPSKFTLVERNQIDRVIAEQGFQLSLLTNQQMVRVGQILNLQKMVVGDVNIVSGQYNVDVRVVDVETGAVNATDGATWAKTSSYRELMRSLAIRLMTKMNTTTSSVSSNTPGVASNTVVVLYGYLKVFPEDLGDFPSVPVNVIAAINSDVPHGYNDWRVPTIEEMALIKANKNKIAGIGNSEYMTSDGQRSGVLRLVTTGKTFAEAEEERKVAEAEQRRIAEQKAAEQRRLAEERRIREAEQSRLAEETRQREERIMASLSIFDVARLYMLKTYRRDINYIPSSQEISGRSEWSYVDHRQLSSIPAMQKLLTVHRFWWGHQEVNNYNNQPIPLINDRRGHSLPNWTNISVYDSQSRSYTTQRMAFASRHQIDGQLPSDVVFQNECLYADLYYRQLSSTEATRLAEQIIRTASTELRKTEEQAEQARILAERQRIEQEKRAEEARIAEEARKAEEERERLAAENATLLVLHTTLEFEASGGSRSVNVATNMTQFRATSTTDWLSFGISSNQISITCKANETTSDRIGHIDIMAGNKTVRVTIKQSGIKKTAVIEKVWQEQNVSENGVKGMNIHIHFKVYNMLGIQGNCTVWFYLKDGTELKDSNGRYRTTAGQVSTFENFTPSYANSEYSDFVIFMPYSELHCPNDKLTELKFDIGVFDDAKNQMIVSDFYGFSYGVRN